MVCLVNIKKLSLALAAGVYTLSQPHALADTPEPEAQLTDVVVMGEKNKRTKFDTSTSVDVFDRKRLKTSANPTTASDVLKMTVNTVDLGSGNDLPTVRGIDGSGPAQGAVAFFAGTRPRLNLAVDGRSATYNEFAFGSQSLWDIKQVEVLRGPQSLAQGKNAIAGAIVLTSNDPSDVWEGAVKLGVGNQNSSQTAAMVSGPLIEEELSFRLSVDRQKRESFVKLKYYPEAGDPRKIETTTTRAKLLFTPSAFPDFYSRLTINHVKSRAPQNEALDNPGSMRYSPERPVFETSATSGIWDVHYRLNPQWSFENKFIYTQFDNDRLALPMPKGTPAKLDGHEVQIEPMLRFNTEDKRLSGLVGLHYFAGKQDETVDLMPNRNYFDDKTKTQAIFGELTFAATPTFDVTLASRIERESHQRHGGSNNVRVDLDKTLTVFLPRVDLAWKPSDQTVAGVQVSRGYNPGGAGITFDQPIVSYAFDPEYVWNYELYHRYRNDERRFELSSNVFFNDYKDMQLPYYLGVGSVAIRNAEKVHTYGAEFSGSWHATAKLKVLGSVGVLKTKIKRYADSGLEGNQLTRAPSLTLSSGVDYQFGNGWDVGGDVRYIGDYYSNYQNDSLGKIDAYTQVNLYAGYRFKSGRIGLYAHNIFDSGHDIFIPAKDRHDALVQRPRAVGVTAEYQF